MYIADLWRCAFRERLNEVSACDCQTHLKTCEKLDVFALTEADVPLSNFVSVASPQGNRVVVCDVARIHCHPRGRPRSSSHCRGRSSNADVVVLVVVGLVVDFVVVRGVIVVGILRRP